MYTIHHATRANGTTIQARYGWSSQRQTYTYSVVLCEAHRPKNGGLDTRHYAKVIRVLATGIDSPEAARSVVDVLAEIGLPPVHAVTS